jgi:hypothetical protein
VSDSSALGPITADLMDKIESQYPEGAKVASAIVVAQVEYEIEDGSTASALEWFCSSESPVIQAGLLSIAAAASTRDFGREVGGDE